LSYSDFAYIDAFHIIRCKEVDLTWHSSRDIAKKNTKGGKKIFSSVLLLKKEDQLWCEEVKRA